MDKIKWENKTYKNEIKEKLKMDKEKQRQK